MSTFSSSQNSVPADSANVVIVGGGVIGCSIAYHLAERGWKDVVVLERRAIGCGSTWHAHGLIGLIRTSLNMTRLALHTNKVLKQLEAETGLSTGFKQNGALILATSETHLKQLRRVVSMMKPTGLELHEVSVAEARRIWPIANMNDVISAFVMPEEGQVNPLDTLQAYASAARKRGVRIYERTPALAVESNRGRVTGVRTASGLIRAEHVVIAAGLWSWDFGRASSIDVPLMAVEQSYVVTEPISEIVSGLPILRDFERGLNGREDAKQLAIGATAPPEKPWGYDGIPESFEFEELQGDWQRYEPMFAHILHRVPVLERIGIRKFLTGPESIAPDSRYLLGDAPGLRGCIVATGMSGVGVGSSGGIGREIACWLDDGGPSLDIWDCDIRRMMPFEVNKHYLFDKVTETGGALFEILSPEYQPKAARDVRLSPLHDRLAAAGAFFEVTAGWEIPSHFTPRKQGSDSARPEWISSMLDEQRTLENGVCLSDLSSHSNFIVDCRDDGTAFERIAARLLPAEPGLHRLVPFLNDRGGVEFVADVMRLGEHRFHLLIDPSQQNRAARHLDAELSGTKASVFDASSGLAIFWLAGTEAASLLREMGVRELPQPGGHAMCDFGYSRSSILGFGGDGSNIWQVLVPAEFAQNTYNHLVAVKSATSLVHLGRRARQSLLIEAGAPHREMKIDSTASVGANGLASLVDWQKPDGFVGRAAAQDVEQQSRWQAITVVLRDADPLLFGNEPIWSGDRLVGHVVQVGYSQRCNAAVGFGRVEKGADKENITIEVAMERISAKVLSSSVST